MNKPSVSSVEGTILILDSEPVSRTVLCEALESAGNLVVTAADLGAAVDCLSEVEPDLLIVRPYINSMPGHIAADYLRTKSPGLPVLMIAGLPDDDRVRVQNKIRNFHTFPPAIRCDAIVAEVRRVLKYELQKKAVREWRDSAR